MRESHIWAPVLDPLNQISQRESHAYSKLGIITFGLHFPNEGSLRKQGAFDMC